MDSEQDKMPLFGQLAALMAARLFLNIIMRMVYPFAPALARGLGVNVTAVYTFVTLRNFTGLLSPVFGPLSERFGRKTMLIVAMLLFSLGCLIIVLWPTYWILGLTLALAALAKVIYDPAMQAHIGDIVPYARRGKAVAFTEYSWSLALLIGAPAVGFLIYRFGWQAPFLGLAIGSLLTILLLSRFLSQSGRTHNPAGNYRAALNIVRQYPVIWAAILFMILVMAANEMLFIVYGEWMETSFGLSLTSLGLAAAVIGGSEIIGETFAGWSVDHFGKRPIVILAGLCTAIFYFLVPRATTSLALTLLLLFMLFLFFEITVVGSIPLITELVPSARGVVMSLNLTAMLLGRAVGAILGPLTKSWGGYEFTGFVAAFIMVMATLVLANWVREGHIATMIESPAQSG